jgi:hypothetical protein
MCDADSKKTKYYSEKDSTEMISYDLRKAMVYDANDQLYCQIIDLPKNWLLFFHFYLRKLDGVAKKPFLAQRGGGNK